MNSIRAMIEDKEIKNLSAYATFAKGANRLKEETSCDFRTSFQRDRDRIIHSKAFRRLKHKTQVYIAPGDHFRMRMTHSLEVAQISRTIARGLSLNEDLVEAIALAHDVGHTPFGHVGEYALREIIGDFKHNEQSLRIVDYVERNWQGLNLTMEVRDGILNHTGDNFPFTLEGNIVRMGDRIAYLCHDYDDGLRAGLISTQDLPSFVSRVLGTKPSMMITVMVSDMINQSLGKSDIRISQEVGQAMHEFREFMFQKVYNSKLLDQDRNKGRYVIHKLYENFMKYPEKMPVEFLKQEEKWGLQKIVVDYVAGLTDVFAVKIFEDFFIPAMLMRW